MPTARSRTHRTGALPTSQVDTGAVAEPRAPKVAMWPKSRARSGTPCAAWCRARTSCLSLAMSTLLGHCLAGLAPQAEVHDVVHLPARERLEGEPAGEDGPQGVGASAGAVGLLPRGHVGGAHRPAREL